MLTRTAEPAVEPLTLAEAKSHLRVTWPDDDALIALYLSAARGDCEGEIDRAFVTTGFRLTLDEFPTNLRLPLKSYERPIPSTASAIRVPVARLIAVSSVTYLDVTGTRQTLSPSAYTVEAGDFARIAPAYGTAWPACRTHPGSVAVDFTAGYGDTAADVPFTVKAAILLTLGHLWENREDVVVGTGMKAEVLPAGARSLLARESWGAYP